MFCGEPGGVEIEPTDFEPGGRRNQRRPGISGVMASIAVAGSTDEALAASGLVMLHGRLVASDGMWTARRTPKKSSGSDAARLSRVCRQLARHIRQASPSNGQHRSSGALPALGNAAPLHLYEPGSWGPQETERLLPASHGGWHKPLDSKRTS